MRRNGYAYDSVDQYNPYNVIHSNRITMEQTPFPLYGIGMDSGMMRRMYPGKNYNFPKDRSVLEMPMYQDGSDSMMSDMGSGLISGGVGVLSDALMPTDGSHMGRGKKTGSTIGGILGGAAGVGLTLLTGGLAAPAIPALIGAGSKVGGGIGGAAGQKTDDLVQYRQSKPNDQFGQYGQDGTQGSVMNVEGGEYKLNSDGSVFEYKGSQHRHGGIPLDKMGNPLKDSKGYNAGIAPNNDYTVISDKLGFNSKNKPTIHYTDVSKSFAKIVDSINKRSPLDAGRIEKNTYKFIKNLNARTKTLKDAYYGEEHGQIPL